MEIEGFELIAKLGEGAESVVWQARQTSLDRLVALRVFESARLPKDRLDAILRNVSACARIKHSHLIQTYDVGETNGHTYVAMEHIEGSTVEQYIRAGTPLPEQTVLKIAEAVAYALDAAWREAQLTHGNIHPGNIMLDETGAVKLADIGIAPAEAAEPGIPLPSSLLAPHFKSPEHAVGIDTGDIRTDMYCLGAALYYMITGRRPFDGHAPETTLAMHVDGFLTNPRDLNPAVSAAATKLLGRLLAKSTEHRFENWAAAIEEIQAAAAGRLLIRKSSPNPVSSIDRRKSGAPSQGHPGRRATDRAAAVPAWFRTPAWLLLVAFWGFVGYRQYTQPLFDPPWQASLPSLPSPTRPTRPTAPPAARAVQPAAAPETTDLVLDAAPVAPAVPTPPEPKLTDEEEKVLDLARQQIAAALLAGDPETARRAASPSSAAGASEALRRASADLLAFVNDVTSMDQMIAAAFAGKVNTEVSVQIDGEWRRIIPQAVSGINVAALLVQGGGSSSAPVPVSLTIAELSPAEKQRWVAPGETPVLNAIRLLLSFQAGEPDKARSLAAACGPLADAFAQQL